MENHQKWFGRGFCGLCGGFFSYFGPLNNRFSAMKTRAFGSWKIARGLQQDSTLLHLGFRGRQPGGQLGQIHWFWNPRFFVGGILRFKLGDVCHVSGMCHSFAFFLRVSCFFAFSESSWLDDIGCTLRIRNERNDEMKLKWYKPPDRTKAAPTESACAPPAQWPTNVSAWSSMRAARGAPAKSPRDRWGLERTWKNIATFTWVCLVILC